METSPRDVDEHCSHAEWVADNRVNLVPSIGVRAGVLTYHHIEVQDLSYPYGLRVDQGIVDGGVRQPPRALKGRSGLLR